MQTSRPFAADSNKLAYAQAFTRSTTAHPHARAERTSLRGLALRLNRTGKPTR